MSAAVTLRRFGPALPVLVFLALFYAYPLWEILGLGLGRAVSNPGSLRALWGDYYPRILFFTFWQAALSTILTLLAALPGAWLLSRFEFHGRRLFEALVTIPFVLPTVVVATAFRTLGDPDSILGGLLRTLGLYTAEDSQGLGFILAAHVFYNYSLALRTIATFWKSVPRSYAEAARLQGASPLRAFVTITLPLLTPAILAAGLLIFLFCFGSFGVILLLGGLRYSTLEVEIYRQAAHVFNLPLAAILSILQLGVTFVVMRVQIHFQQRSTRPLTADTRPLPLHTADPGIRFRSGLYLALVATALLLPLFSLGLESFRPNQQWGLSGYLALWDNPRNMFLYVPPIQALKNSLLYALTATALALPLGLCAAVFVHTRTPIARLLDPFFMLPMTTSAVTLGFGFIIALDQPPLNLRASWILVPIAHALVAFPFVLRTVLPALAAVPQSLRDAAGTLGAGPWRVWASIDLPLLARAALLGAIYSFVISLGEFGATIFIARPATPTLPLVIYRALSLPGATNQAQALAASTLFMLLCGLCFLALDALSPRRGNTP